MITQEDIDAMKDDIDNDKEMKVFKYHLVANQWDYWVLSMGIEWVTQNCILVTPIDTPT